MTDDKEEKQEEPLPDVTDVTCPICNEAKIGPRKGRYGLYWTCISETKKCRFNLSAKPIGRNCEFKRNADADPCGAIMVEGTKTIPERCSEKGCPNRNPHKL